MCRGLLLVVMALALAASGCADNPAYFHDRSPEPVAMLPGGVDLSGAWEGAYSFEASFGFDFGDREFFSGVGPTISSSDETAMRAGVNWHWTGSVKEQYDEMPIALRPVKQMASDIGIEVGMGGVEPSTGSESDVMDYRITANYISPQAAFKGLGFGVAYGSRAVDDATVPGTDLDQKTLSADLVYHIPQVTGLIAMVGLEFTDTELGPWEWAVDSLTFGARYYRKLGAMNHWIDGELSLGTIDYEPGPLIDDGATELGLKVTYYPTKELGVGFDWASRDWDDRDMWDEDRLGLSVTYCVKGVRGLDVNIRWSKAEADVWGSENSGISFSVDYRF